MKPRYLPCRVKELTDRQKQVIELVCLGKTNVEIGAILGISGLTAKNHVNECCRKLEATSRTLLAVKYVAPERFKK